MAFDAGPSRRPSLPLPDEPTPWWEWLSRILSVGSFAAIYVTWLIHTVGGALSRAFGH